MFKFIFILMAVFLMACSEGAQVNETPSNPNEIVIRPSAGVVSPGTGDLRVGFVRTDANQTDYTTADLLYATWRGALSGTDATAIEFDNAQYYLPNGAETELIGFYPADDLVKYDKTTTILTIPFDTSTDILLTAPVKGSRANKFGTGDRNFTFKHQLACLKFNIYISTEDAAAGWGTIKSIDLIKQSDSCYVKMPDIVSFDNPTDTLRIAPRHYADNTEITYPFVLPTTVGKANALECGYAMIAPFPMPDGATNADRLQVIITHEVNGHESQVKTGLAFPTATSGENAGQQTGWEAGYVYTVNLGMSAQSVDITSTITEYLDGGTIDVEL